MVRFWGEENGMSFDFVVCSLSLEMAQEPKP